MDNAHWMKCVLLGAMSLPIGGLMRFIPCENSEADYAEVNPLIGMKAAVKRYVRVLCVVLCSPSVPVTPFHPSLISFSYLPYSHFKYCFLSHSHLTPSLPPLHLVLLLLASTAPTATVSATHPSSSGCSRSPLYPYLRTWRLKSTGLRMRELQWVF